MTRETQLGNVKNRNFDTYLTRPNCETNVIQTYSCHRTLIGNRRCSIKWNLYRFCWRPSGLFLISAHLYHHTAFKLGALSW